MERSARNVFADLEHATEEELREFEEEFKALRARGISQTSRSARRGGEGGEDVVAPSERRSS